MVMLKWWSTGLLGRGCGQCRLGFHLVPPAACRLLRPLKRQTRIHAPDHGGMRRSRRMTYRRQTVRLTYVVDRDLQSLLHPCAGNRMSLFLSQPRMYALTPVSCGRNYFCFQIPIQCGRINPKESIQGLEDTRRWRRCFVCVWVCGTLR